MIRKFISLQIIIFTMYSSYAHSAFSNPNIIVSEDSRKWASEIRQALAPQLRELSRISLIADYLPPKWSIIFTEKLPGPNVGGLFIPNQKDPQGNPVLFMSPSEMILNKDVGLLAHETFHLVHSKYRPQEEGWVKEGLALVIEANASQKYLRQLPLAFDVPQVSLMAPIDLAATTSEEIILRSSQYAHLQLFFQYLFRHCGGWKLFRTIAYEPAPTGFKGVQLIDWALKVSNLVYEGNVRPDFCESTATLHEQFQRIKYWPRFDLATGHLTDNPSEIGRLVDGPQTKMPRLSAVAFPRMSEGCPAGSTVLSPQLCIQIQGP